MDFLHVWWEGRGYTDCFSGDMETCYLRLNDRLGVKGKGELAAKCGTWPEKQREEE